MKSAIGGSTLPGRGWTLARGSMASVAFAQATAPRLSAIVWLSLRLIV